MLRGSGAQGSAHVRAATAQIQRRKWTLERSRFDVDYNGNLSENPFSLMLAKHEKPVQIRQKGEGLRENLLVKCIHSSTVRELKSYSR
jgi:hypothetical protein